MSEEIRRSVEEYYGKILSSNKDLQSNACKCSTEDTPNSIRAILSELHPKVCDSFYGCGSPIPPALNGASVLDLGCGSGRDTYILSRLVGPEGQVTGVDMTAEQLEIAEECKDWQMDKFGYCKPNVEFKKGYIEDLSSLSIEDNSLDVVVSNCVINLSPDKKSVLSEIFRVLRPGGELYFSDVFCDRRLPASLMEDREVLGECLAGAMYTEDFRRLLLETGCPDFRILRAQPFEISNQAIRDRIGPAVFSSLTVRAFKLKSLEDRCEDYGQIAIYQGSIPDFPHQFILDDHHVLEKDRPLRVCGNTASMLQETRFSEHFKITGSRQKHFGLFACGSEEKLQSERRADVSCC